MMGININDKHQPFTEQILNGMKTIETRNSRSLDPYLGKRVGIVRTGKNKAMLVGFATIHSRCEYQSSQEFDCHYLLHLVAKDSKYYIQSGKKKYGYLFTDVERITPQPVHSKGIVSRKINPTNY